MLLKYEELSDLDGSRFRPQDRAPWRYSNRKTQALDDEVLVFWRTSFDCGYWSVDLDFTQSWEINGHSITFVSNHVGIESRRLCGNTKSFSAEEREAISGGLPKYQSILTVASDLDAAPQPFRKFPATTVSTNIGLPMLTLRRGSTLNAQNLAP